MTRDTLKALKTYLLLTHKEKLTFLSEVTKIEKMSNAVKADYEKTLLSLANDAKANEQ
jgi:hypothetical protein